MLIDALNVGGAETHVQTLAKHLNKMGCEVIVASSGGQISQNLKSEGVRHILLPTFNLKASASFKEKHAPMVSIGIAREVLKRIIITHHPDVVHAHTRKTAFLAMGICKQESIPLITTAHAMFNMRGLKNPLSFWGDGTIVISEDIKQHIEKASIFKPKFSKIIRNGVEIPPKN